MKDVVVKNALDKLVGMIEEIDSVNSMIENLGCTDGTIIGTGRSDYTQGSKMYNLSIENRCFALIDIPGIEGDERAFEHIIEQSLEHAHVIFYVNGSGKKIEKETLLKIKKYMHDGTSVYAIFNTHCKAKRERIPGIDKGYSEELEQAYKMQENIVRQTENELKSFLGENYKGSICLNGLLGFCSVAFINDSKTSIKHDDEKNLRKDQTKYLKEYSGDRERMIKDSRVAQLIEVLETLNRNFDKNIVEENLKKLKNRMNEMLSKISVLKTREIKKVDGFINIYDDFESNCYNAKEDFINTMKHVAINAASDAFYDLMNELFDRVEKDGGKTKSKEIQNIFLARKDDVVASIQQGVNDKISRAQNTFKEAIKDAQERMAKDFEREQICFEISLSADSIKLNNAFADALKYNLKDFGKHAYTVGSLAISFLEVGTFICPGLGTVIGAGVGLALGVLSSIWNYFVSEKKRVNKAKLKIGEEIEKQIEVITGQINDELLKLSYEQKINGVFDVLYEKAEEQKKSMIDIKNLIRNVESEMNVVYNSIA